MLAILFAGGKTVIYYFKSHLILKFLVPLGEKVNSLLLLSLNIGHLLKPTALSRFQADFIRIIIFCQWRGVSEKLTSQKQNLQYNGAVSPSSFHSGKRKKKGAGKT